MSTKAKIIMFIVMIVPLSIIMALKQRKARLIKEGTYEQKQAATYRKLTAFFKNFFLTRRSFKECLRTMSTLECYGEEELKREACVLYMRTLGIASTYPLLGILFTKNIVVGFVLLLISYVYYRSALTTKVDKAEANAVDQMSIVLASIRERYLETKSITSALLLCEKPKELATPILKIYSILTSVNSKEELEEFQRTYPLKIVRTLANMCFISLDQGDEFDIKSGKSAFVENIQLLINECSNKSLLNLEQKLAFRFQTEVVLAGLAFFMGCQAFSRTMIAGSAGFIDSVLGQILTVVVVLITGVIYFMVANAAKTSVVNEIDTSTRFLELLENRKFRKFVQDFVPKKAKNLNKVQRRLNTALSTKTPLYLYGQKVVFCFAGLILSFVLGTITILVARNNIYNNYSQMNMGDNASLTVDTVEKRKILDKEWMKFTEQEIEEMTDREKIIFIRKKFNGIDEGTAKQELDRVTKKREYYHAAKYDNRIAIFAAIFSVVCWFVPDIGLRQRAKMVRSEADEDISQLQTMMIVLSGTNFRVFEVLYWLERQSELHKLVLKTAYNSFYTNYERALDRLVASSPSMDFRRLVRKLKAALYNLSIKDAFNGMRHEKESSMSRVLTQRRDEIRGKAAKSRFLSMGVFIIAVIFGMVVPIGVIALGKMAAVKNLGGQM